MLSFLSDEYFKRNINFLKDLSDATQIACGGEKRLSTSLQVSKILDDYRQHWRSDFYLDM